MHQFKKLLLFVVILCSAAVVYAQSGKVTINVQNVPLRTVLDKLEKQTGITFSYDEKVIAQSKNVSLTARAANLQTVLNSLSQKTGLEYTVLDDKHVVISRPAPKQGNKPFTLTGVLVDENGDPLIGASVNVKGQNKGVTTDADGRFSLPGVQPGSELTMSFIGYTGKTVKVNGAEPLHIKLTPSSTSLNEVVVVGYGQMKKSDLTGSISAVKGSEVASRKTTQLSTALQGSLAGVSVSRDNSAPGATASINVRGITTISDSSPLVIIDGVPGDLNSINPDDVESISVLKDAASASIYGARAAAGVIIVTTRRASDGKLNLSYNFDYGWSKPTTLPEYVGATRYLEMVNELRYNDNPSGGWFQTYSEDKVNNWVKNNITDPDQYPVVDWTRELLRKTAPRYTHVVSITGGNDRVRSNASLRYDKTDGLYINKEYQRFMARVNNDFVINSYLTAHFDMNFSRGKSSAPNFNPMGADERKLPPIYAVRWTNGMWGDVKNGENLLAKMTDGGTTTGTDQRVGGKLALDLKPLSGLTVTGVVAPNWRNYDAKQFVKQVPYTYANDPATIVNYMGGCATTRLTETRNSDYDITSQFFANYTRQWGKNGFSVMAGYEDFYSRWDYLTAARDKYELTGFPFLDLGSKDFQTNSGNALEYAYHSIFGRLTYNYDERYLLQVNMRRDGSSRFAKNCRWANFPSVSGGWVVSNEKFFKQAGMGWFNFLKLRGSWGRLGNERIGSYYPYQASINFGSVLLQDNKGNTTSNTSAAQNTYAVRDITWETTESWDLGLDARFLRDRLRLTFDYYNKKTKDMLLALEIPGYMGFGNPDVNAGSMRTKGFDLELAWTDSFGDLTYSVNANLSDYNSKMGNLNGTQFLGDKVKFEGSYFNEWYGYLSDGLYQTAEEVKDSPKLNNAVTVGDIRYKDINGDGLISADKDRVLLGNSLPRFMYGFGANAAYKGFDLGIMFNGVGSQKMRITPSMIEGYANNWTNFPMLLEGNYWSAKNTPEQNLAAKYPRLTSTSRNNNLAMSDFWIFEGRYLRLKNLTLGYTLPRAVTQKAQVQSLRFYVTGNDLFSISKFPKGWDPEVGPTGYPICREFIVGANITF